MSGGGVPVTRNLFAQDFWSEVRPTISVVNAPADISLPYVSVQMPAATILAARAMFKFRIVENTNVAINALSGGQVIQIQDSVFPTSPWQDAINLIGGILSTPPTSREGGDVIMGTLDLSVVVLNASTFIFQWAQALAGVPNLNIYDSQIGLRIWYQM